MSIIKLVQEEEVKRHNVLRYQCAQQIEAALKVGAVTTASLFLMKQFDYDSIIRAQRVVNLVREGKSLLDAERMVLLEETKTK